MACMRVDEFLARVARLPEVSLVRRTPTVCFLRCASNGHSRDIRLGLWAIREFSWERLVEELQRPPAPS